MLLYGASLIYGFADTSLPGSRLLAAGQNRRPG
jgi:hypothetical protein